MVNEPEAAVIDAAIDLVGAARFGDPDTLLAAIYRYPDDVRAEAAGVIAWWCAQAISRLVPPDEFLIELQRAATAHRGTSGG